MKLNQITVPSIDLEKSVAFYKNLGFKLIVDSIPRYARFICPDGEATFSIHQVPALSTGPGTIIYFESERLDELVDELKTKGIRFEHNPVDQTWLWREARLQDPDGNQLILFHAGQHRQHPPWRIN